jgi:hypothetical protein
LNEKTDPIGKGPIRNITTGENPMTKKSEKESAISESFFCDDKTKIARRLVKSKVRIQSGKTVAQH